MVEGVMALDVSRTGPAPGAGPLALAIENIEVIYNHSVQALRGLSIEVPAGSIVALLGSNGAGKTTTLKAASGILPFETGRVASGRIRVDTPVPATPAAIVATVAGLLARFPADGPFGCTLPARWPVRRCRRKSDFPGR